MVIFHTYVSLPEGIYIYIYIDIYIYIIYILYIYGIIGFTAGWWFGTMELYEFPFSWKCHHPNWRTHIFQMGRYTTNQFVTCLFVNISGITISYNNPIGESLIEGFWRLLNCLLKSHVFNVIPFFQKMAISLWIGILQSFAKHTLW